MSANKPTIPKGMRDFSPSVMFRRNYIFSIIKNIFEKYGFNPIETSAMENLDTLIGQYGNEGDKFLGIEGSVEVKNVESGEKVTLNENSTVVSTSNGSIITQTMTTEDFEQVDDLEDESGEYEDFDIVYLIIFSKV